MALALYRRYRPGTFADVVGQEHVTEPLRAALAAGRINHAYLFSGPRGCGKTSSARIMARSLNCVQGPTPDPCGVCESCVALAPTGPGSLDVTEIDAASHGTVDEARDLRDRVQFAPVASRYRVFIIDEAHMVTTAGFNALLKVVEEPPDHLIFIFATTEPEKVLPTIRSRTHHYPFRLLPPSTLRGLLERICGEERVPVEPAVYPLVVRAGGGSARDSLSVLDQLLAGAGADGITYSRAVGLLGVTDVALLDDVVDALGARDGPAVFGAVDRLVEAGHDPRRFTADLLQRLRDLILVHAVPDAGEKGLVDVPADEMERMVDQAARLGPAALARHAELAHTALTEMRGATAPRLLLELVCARMLLPSASSADAALVQRLEGVERRLQNGSGGEPERFVRPSQRPEEASAAEPAPESSGPAPRAADDDATVAPPTGRPTATVEAPREGGARGDADRGGGDEDDAAVRGRGWRPGEDGAGHDRADDDGRSAGARGDDAGAGDAVAGRARDDDERTRTPPPAVKPAPTSTAPGTMDTAGLRRVWPEVMKAVRERNKPTHALLQNATVAAVEGTTLTLAMPTPPLARQLGQPNRASHVEAALGAVLSGQWTLRAQHGTETPTGPSVSGSDAARSERPAPGRPTASRGAPPDRSEGGRSEDGRSGGGRTEGGRSEGGRSAGGSSHGAPDAGARGGAESGAAGPRSGAEGPRGGAAGGGGGEPSSGSGERPRFAPPQGRGAPPADVPPPPEPPEEDEVTEDDMYAEAAAHPSGTPDGVRRDPEEVAMELLSQELGARRVEGR